LRVEKEDHHIIIDLDNIEGKQKHWVYRVIKEEGHEKSIITNKEDLIVFSRLQRQLLVLFKSK